MTLQQLFEVRRDSAWAAPFESRLTEVRKQVDELRPQMEALLDEEAQLLRALWAQGLHEKDERRVMTFDSYGCEADLRSSDLGCDPAHVYREEPQPERARAVWQQFYRELCRRPDRLYYCNFHGWEALYNTPNGAVRVRPDGDSYVAVGIGPIEKSSAASPGL